MGSYGGSMRDRKQPIICGTTEFNDALDHYESAMSVTFCRGRWGRPRKLANSLASFRGEPFGGVVM